MTIFELATSPFASSKWATELCKLHSHYVSFEKSSITSITSGPVWFALCSIVRLILHVETKKSCTHRPQNAEIWDKFTSHFSMRQDQQCQKITAFFDHQSSSPTPDQISDILFFCNSGNRKQVEWCMRWNKDIPLNLLVKNHLQWALKSFPC